MPDSFGLNGFLAPDETQFDTAEERFHLTGAKKALTTAGEEQEPRPGRLWENRVAGEGKFPPESNSAVSQNAQNL